MLVHDRTGIGTVSYVITPAVCGSTTLHQYDWLSGIHRPLSHDGRGRVNEGPQELR